jgi:hypothetical protein
LPLDMLSMGFVWVILGLLPVAVNKVLGDRDVARHLQAQKPSVPLQPKHASKPQGALWRHQTAHHQNAFKHPPMTQGNAFTLMPTAIQQPASLAAMPFVMSTPPQRMGYPQVQPALPTLVWPQP